MNSCVKHRPLTSCSAPFCTTMFDDFIAGRKHFYIPVLVKGSLVQQWQQYSTTYHPSLSKKLGHSQTPFPISGSSWGNYPTFHTRCLWRLIFKRQTCERTQQASNQWIIDMVITAYYWSIILLIWILFLICICRIFGCRPGPRCTLTINAWRHYKQ